MTEIEGFWRSLNNFEGCLNENLQDLRAFERFWEGSKKSQVVWAFISPLFYVERR